MQKNDIEKSDAHVVYNSTVEDVRPRTGIRAKMWSFVEAIDRYGVEVRGIERVRADERSLTDSPWDACTLWMAANCQIATFSLGTLGPSLFGLGLKDSFLTIVVFNLVFNIPVAYFSTFGPKLGLRQMTLGRFSFGYFTTIFPVILQIIACVGWSTVNTIAGASVLQAVNPDSSHDIPTAAAIVVIAVGSCTISLFGYKVVHLYERYSFYPVAIIFIILLGLSAKYMVSDWAETGPIEAGNILSFGAALVGFGLGWASYAADYTVNLPEKTSSWKIFWLTYLGLNLPLILVETLAAAMVTVTPPDYQAQYASGGVGGLISAGLSPAGGFGKFLLVLLGLSSIAGNIPNMYSLALATQVLGTPFQKIPRFFLVALGTVAYIVLSIVGASHFDEWLDNFLVLLSYWLAIYSAIVIEEHLIFRKGNWANYLPDAYNMAGRLPLGLAALFALCCGIAGAVLGMSTAFYVGVIARQIGDPAVGGDIGFELSFAFSAIAYPPARYLEQRFQSPKRNA